MNIAIDLNVLSQLNTTESRTIHDICDKLSVCGINSKVKVPQIVVIGEESSGKSSVLQAISHLRFPTGENGCTRFATQVVFRQAPETRIDITIIFEDKSKGSRTLQNSGFQEDDLAHLIEEAKGIMEINRAGKDFSKDLLRLEIEGPQVYPLSLLDLPGLPNSDKSPENIEILQSIADSHLDNKDNIFLVVISPNKPLSEQAALTKCRLFDPHGERTIPIITKPDLMRPGTVEERNYIKSAMNRESMNHFSLGWHVLCSRREEEPSSLSRDATEDQFFRDSAWSCIPLVDRGVASLRKKLSHALYQHMRRALPLVVEDIDWKLHFRESDMEGLGSPRSTPEEMRSFLISVASDFQRVVQDGIYGRYHDSFFLSQHGEITKLRAQIRDLSQTFDYVMRFRGPEYDIGQPNTDKPERRKPPKHLIRFIEHYDRDEFEETKSITKEEFIYKVVEGVIFNRGVDFPGSHINDCARRLLQHQVSAWNIIAIRHAELVFEVAKAFVDRVFQFVFGPRCFNGGIEAILTTCVDPFFDEKKVVMQAKVNELFKPYEQGFAFPLDLDGCREFSQRSGYRLAERVYNLMTAKAPTSDDERKEEKVARQMIREAVASEKDSEIRASGIYDVIDIMSIYYEYYASRYSDGLSSFPLLVLLIAPAVMLKMLDLVLPHAVGFSRPTSSESDGIDWKQYNLRSINGALAQLVARQIPVNFEGSLVNTLDS
ncbi:interferon-induced GTP-binding Mx [Fusarium phyllophilum]|uniref:Interferon-induced GTP-binding Mx n=1 Tax=Fusarium phyllophilum TaxID=47803 RepID=A0A8H5KBF0_9HYPO|nr:interferon-induced GTP-binding Mx [Fusarium phyllophilum]